MTITDKFGHFSLMRFLPIKRDPPSYFLKNLDLPQDHDACLEIALSQEPIMIDTIVCNDEIVTNGVNLQSLAQPVSDVQ
jgi:hypothetical protein